MVTTTTFAEVAINKSNAVINEYERCSTNSYVVFERSKDCTIEGIVFACKQGGYELYKELEKKFPFDDGYIIHHCNVYESLTDDKTYVDVYLS